MACEPHRLFPIGPRRSATSPARAGCKFVSSTLLASTVLSRAARIAIPVIVLNGVSGVASAQDATWGAPGANANWNTATNWIPANIPGGATGTATFTGNLPTGISMAGAVAVGTLEFTAPNYVFNVDAAGLQAFDDQVSDPGSPFYRQFLSPEEVGAK